MEFHWGLMRPLKRVSKWLCQSQIKSSTSPLDWRFSEWFPFVCFVGKLQIYLLTNPSANRQTMVNASPWDRQNIPHAILLEIFVLIYREVIVNFIAFSIFIKVHTGRAIVLWVGLCAIRDIDCGCRANTIQSTLWWIYSSIQLRNNNNFPLYFPKPSLSQVSIAQVSTWLEICHQR